jgi:hypothetical protein
MYDPSRPSAWLDYADRSYMGTRLLWFCHFIFDAPVNAHRTIELYLKAYLVSKGAMVRKGSPSWGHELDNLRLQCEKYNNSFSNDEFARRVRYFQRYFDLVRYPTDIKEEPKDGSMIWLGIDAMSVIDEIVAFIRPRIYLSDDDWSHTWLNGIYTEKPDQHEMQYRALVDQNKHIEIITCNHTSEPNVEFNKDFNLDFPGC